MIPGFVQSWIIKLLANYIEEVSEDTLQFGVLQGTVELNNVRVKQSLIDSIDLPFDLKFGSLGNLKISIPWNNIFGINSISIRMKDLFIIAGPQRVFSPDSNQKRKEKEKLDEILRLDFYDLAKKESKDDNVAEETPGTSTWRSAIINSLARSMCFIIENIHLRYEDEITFAPSKLSLGLTLETLNLRPSSDDSIFIIDQQKMDPEDIMEYINKKFELKNLRAYCYPDGDIISNKDKNSIIQILSSMISKLTTIDSENLYILKPVDVDMALSTRIKQGTPNIKTPDTLFDMSITPVLLSIDQEQLRLLSSFTKKVEDMKLLREFKELKPRVRPRDNPRAWWSFLRQLFISSLKKRAPNLEKRRRNRLKYIELRKKKFLKSITEGELFQLNILEKELPTSDIRYFRALADVEMYLSGIDLKAPKSNTWSWLGSLWKSNANIYTPMNTYILTPKLRKHLIESLGIELEATKETAGPSQSVIGNLKLSKIMFRLHDTNNLPLFIAQTKTISTSVTIGLNQEDIERGFVAKKMSRVLVDVSQASVRIPLKQGHIAQSMDLSMNIGICVFTEDTTTKTEIQVKELTLQKLLTNKAISGQSRRIYLVNPSYIYIGINMEPRGTYNLVNVKIMGSKITASFSEKDVYFLLYLVARLQREVLHSLPKEPEKKNEMVLLMQYKKNLEKRPKKKMINKESRVIASITLLGTLISILNDVDGNNRASLVLSVNDILADVDKNSKGMKLSSHMKLSLNLRNRNNSWTPMLKPWPLFLAVNSFQSKESFHIWSYKNMQLTLTDQMVPLLTDLIEGWKFKELVSVLSSETSFTNSGFSKVNTKGWRDYSAILGTDSRFVISNHLGTEIESKISTFNDKHYLSMKLEDFMASDILLEQGSKVISMPPGGTASNILIDCNTIDSVMYVSISSLVQVKNICKRKVRLGNAEHKTIREHMVLESGQEVFIPWSWIKRNLLSAPLYLESTRFLLNNPICSKLPFSVNIKYSENANPFVGTWGDHLATIEISPSVIVSNHLSFDIEYRILDKNNTDDLIIGHIKAFSNTEIYLENGDFSQYLLSVRLLKYDWSCYVSMGKMETEKQILLENQGFKFPILLDSGSAESSYQIQVYCAYTIVNELDLPLIVKNSIHANFESLIAGNGLRTLTDNVSNTFPILCALDDSQLVLRIDDESVIENTTIDLNGKDPTALLTWRHNQYIPIMFTKKRNPSFEKMTLITLKYRYFIYNLSDCPLYLSQEYQETLLVSTYNEKCSPIYFQPPGGKMKFILRYEDTSWSPRIDASSSQSQSFSLKSNDYDTTLFLDIKAGYPTLIKVTHQINALEFNDIIYLSNETRLRPVKTHDGTRFIKVRDDSTVSTALPPPSLLKHKDRSFHVRLQGITVSLVEEEREIEVVSINLDTLYANVVKSDGLHLTSDLRVRGVQIDSPFYKTFNSSYRTVLIAHPSFVKSSLSKRSEDCFLKLNLKHSTVHEDIQYICLDAKMQKMYITIDQAFVESVINFFNKPIKRDVQFEITSKLRIPEMKLGSPIYIEHMYIHPISLNLSVSMSHAFSETYLPKAVNILAAFIGGIDDFTLNLNNLALSKEFVYSTELGDILGKFYVQQIIRQAMKSVISLESLGSPLSLINEIQTSVHEITENPLSLDSMLSAVYNMAFHSISGVSHSTSNLLGVWSKFLSHFVSNPTPKPSRPIVYEDYESSTSSLESNLAYIKDSVFDSLIGLVKNPVDSVAQNGPKGLVLGLLSGIGGVILKPSIAILESLSNTAEFYHRTVNPIPLRWRIVNIEPFSSMNDRQRLEEILKRLKFEFPEISEHIDDIERVLNN